jgi:hypothetical protein
MNTQELTVRDAAARSERHSDAQRDVRDCLDDVIVEQVLHALGRPPNLHAVQVRPLWLDRVRVNVLLGADAASVLVGHSYFLVISNDGNILSSTPNLTRLY